MFVAVGTEGSFSDSSSVGNDEFIGGNGRGECRGRGLSRPKGRRNAGFGAGAARSNGNDRIGMKLGKKAPEPTHVDGRAQVLAAGWPGGVENEEAL